MGFIITQNQTEIKRFRGAKSYIFREEEMKPFNPANDFTSKIS